MSFNELNPPTSSLLISGDMRANFEATRRHMFSANWLQDPTFECWNVNDTTLPGTWLLGSGAPTFVRETAVSLRKIGPMALRMSSPGAPVNIFQNVLEVTTSYDDYFDSRVVTAGCFINTGTAGIARIRISDGVTTTDSAFAPDTVGLFQFLDVEHLVDPLATQLLISLRVEGFGNAIFSGAVFLFSDIKPDRFVFPPMMRSTIVHSRAGEIFVGPVDEFVGQRAFIVDHVQLRMGVAPTGADAIANVLQLDAGGAGFTSMFTGGGRPRILIGATNGGAVPDGTYNKRCFVPPFGAAVTTAGHVLRSEIDQVGATIIGDDMRIFTRIRSWARPQELIAAFNMDN